MSDNTKLSSRAEQDYFLWLNTTIEQLKARKFGDLDIQRLVEEIEQMGGSLKDALENNLIVVLAHLLKWKYQPEYRSGSWRGSIKEHRRRINKAMKRHPSLKRYFREIFAECYPPAQDWASAETGLPLAQFPAECPFNPEQVLDPEFLPDW
jgi:hypothetical protein